MWVCIDIELSIMMVCENIVCNILVVLEILEGN